MTFTEHKITLDIHRAASSVSLSAKKGDTGRRLLIHLAEKGRPYHIDDGCCAVFSGRKPDGKVVLNDCTIKDCVIIYDFTKQTVAAVGMVECEIILCGSDGNQLTSASFNIIVEDTIYDAETEVESASEYNALADLVANVQAAVDKHMEANPDKYKGPQGETGADGYTPVKGVDYWTEEEQAAIQEDCSNLISEEMAKKAQIEPEFANSVDECTDTTKLYVLPDGYIYAYMHHEEYPYTNQITASVDSDGSAFNGGQGWITGYRLNSSGAEVAFENWEVTGFIPVTQTSIVRFANISFDGDGQGKDYLALYDSSRTLITSGTITYWVTTYGIDDEGQAILDGDGNLTYLDFSRLVSGNFGAVGKDLLANMAYFRLSAYEITDDSIITVDEEIVEGDATTYYAWTNTGHAFVATAYDEILAELETELETQKKQIAALESGESTIPDYVITEAEEVIDRVISAQGNRTFTFAAITDMHYGNSSYSAGVENACSAMKYIDKRIKLDAVAVLGDYTDGYPASGLDNAIGDFKSVSSVLDGLRFAPNLRVQGNHDYYADNFPTTHRFIQAYSEDVCWGDKLGGYFYKDFADFKLRVVCVNTTEENNNYVRCSTAQYEWFASAIDLSGKVDASDWQILVLSHHPLDWYVESEYVFCYILDAYKNGTSGSAGDVSFDYSGGKNSAKLIGNIHGHIHNLLTDYIHFGNVVSGSKTTVLRMSTPEACIDRSNQYSGAWAEDTTYAKTKDTAEDTSFCIYCIDLDACTIKAICYGAGYDREVEYGYTNDVTPAEVKTQSSEEWVFELADGSSVTKQVVVLV